MNINDSDIVCELHLEDILHVVSREVTAQYINITNTFELKENSNKMAEPATIDDVSEEEMKLLEALRTLEMNPEDVDTKENLWYFQKHY